MQALLLWYLLVAEEKALSDNQIKLQVHKTHLQLIMRCAPKHFICMIYFLGGGGLIFTIGTSTNRMREKRCSNVGPGLIEGGGAALFPPLVHVLSLFSRLPFPVILHSY